MYTIQLDGLPFTKRDAFDRGLIPSYAMELMDKEEKNKEMLIGCREMAENIAFLISEGEKKIEIKEYIQ